MLKHDSDSYYFDGGPAIGRRRDVPVIGFTIYRGEIPDN